MAEEEVLYHAHDWVIAKKTYDTSQALSDFFKIIATDTKDGTEFVVAVESPHYPVNGVMFHPET